ncbi:MAG: phosphopyruvate hydratase [Patescibacteria group bacterium]
MPKIEKVSAREIIDSRGKPTIETKITLDDNTSGIASVPSGASTGKYEALELRDEDGKGVTKAIANVNTIIAKTIIGKEFNQKTLDDELLKLDGTPNKSRLGANAILSVSLAFARASAESENQPLYKYFGGLCKNSSFKMPVPMMNILNGGRHAQNSTDFQEFMIVPVGASTFRETMARCEKTIEALKIVLEDRGLSTKLGDEGGFAPELRANETAVQILIEAIRKAGFSEGKEIATSIDVAASELKNDGGYQLKHENRTLTKSELLALYESWTSRYPIISIEDPFSEDEWDAFQELTQKIGNKVQIVGDDLFATNKKRLEEGIWRKAANAIIIKPNQAGTVSETIETATMAKRAGFRLVVSHRSGETEDSSIADLAVGLGAEWVKFGATTQKERMVKYSRLLQIETGLK